nr:hypothetical protein [uncultured Psychroserpens sp.]
MTNTIYTNSFSGFFKHLAENSVINDIELQNILHARAFGNSDFLGSISDIKRKKVIQASELNKARLLESML